MKLVARVALAIFVLLAGLVLLPRPAARVVVPDAYGQIPDPDLPDLIEESPSESPDKGDKDDDKPDPPESPRPPDRDDKGNDDGGNKGSGSGNGKGSTTGSKKGNKLKKDAGAKEAVPAPSGKFNATGEFTTETLQLIEQKLKGRGLSDAKIIKGVYAPFIIAGPAAWTNTWGAPRYGPGPIVRTHEGQDVFCRYGDEVLASEDGTIEFGNGGLGGRVARLYRDDGSYWYYAHLSDWNTKQFESGDRVEVGDVIGYCGNTGNAITTPPHVHFGYYQANGSTRDPMRDLVQWLRRAEHNARKTYQRVTGRSIETIQQTISSRRFGDDFAPDLSELKVSSEALLAASSAPGAGGFGLAQSILQSALAGEAQTTFDIDAYGLGDSAGAGVTRSRISDLLDAMSSSPSSNSGD